MARNRILVVEDDEFISKVIQKNLTSAGYAVAVCYDGNEAAKLIQSDSDFDLALLDVMLPGMDGFELLAYLKHDDIPVIFLTAKADLDSKVHGLRGGAEDYIVKPFEVLELFVRIEKVLERAGKLQQELEAAGLNIIGPPPLGYRYDTVDPRRWVVDEEGAEIVRRIYAMRMEGTSVNDIARKLKREKILTPSAYALKKGYRKPSRSVTRGETFWDTSVVLNILKNQSYLGDVINFRTYSKSYKLKDRLENPEENWDVHEGVHEPVIERSQWEAVQKTLGKTKYRKPKHIEKHMFAGFLKCSDCGANLNYKYTHDNPDNHYFSCRNKRANNGLCAQTHHIRVDTIMALVTRNLSDILRFAGLFEDEFVKIVVDEHYKRIQIQQRKNQTALHAALSREKELDVLFENLYEDKAFGRLTEERFLKLSYKYEDEQSALKQNIQHLKTIVGEENRGRLGLRLRRQRANA